MTGFRRIVVALLAGLLIVGGGAWFFGDEIRDWWRERTGAELAQGEVSEARAARAEERVRAFAAGEGPDSVALTTDDLRSLLRYSAAGGMIPPGIRDPDVSLTDSSAFLQGFLVPEELPGSGDEDRSDALRGLLGDSTVLRAEVVPGVARAGTAEIRVRSLQAGGLSLPSMFVPTVLRRSGLPTEEGRPRSVVFPVPDRLVEIAVRDGELLLRRADPARPPP